MANEDNSVLDEYIELVRFMAGTLLEDDVEVDVKGQDKGNQWRIELFVEEDHRGRVIGRGGRIARAMRSLLNNSGIASSRNVVLDIVD